MGTGLFGQATLFGVAVWAGELLQGLPLPTGTSQHVPASHLPKWRAGCGTADIVQLQLQALLAAAMVREPAQLPMYSLRAP